MSKITLYHYTDAASAQSINKNKTIYGSTDATPKKRRRFGKGVYFTSLSPYNDPKSILLNNYDDAGRVINSRRLWSKIEWVIEVSIPIDEVDISNFTNRNVVVQLEPFRLPYMEKVAEANRDVYLYGGDFDLNLYQHQIYKNPKL